MALGASLNDRAYVYGPLPEPLIRPLAIWPYAWTEGAVPAASIKPRRMLPAAVVMPVDRIKLDCNALFMTFPLVFPGLALAKIIHYFMYDAPLAGKFHTKCCFASLG